MRALFKLSFCVCFFFNRPLITFMLKLDCGHITALLSHKSQSQLIFLLAIIRLVTRRGKKARLLTRIKHNTQQCFRSPPILRFTNRLPGVGSDLTKSVPLNPRPKHPAARPDRFRWARWCDERFAQRLNGDLRQFSFRFARSLARWESRRANSHERASSRTEMQEVNRAFLILFVKNYYYSAMLGWRAVLRHKYGQIIT